MKKKPLEGKKRRYCLRDLEYKIPHRKSVHRTEGFA